ncbi:MAG: NAD(P)-dependent oxidoreductase [Desulfovibrionaceae bacterium]|nr:NAD(P)-dependent oxidoreductase [Desulfovibrionaceae bacterium]
MSDQTYGVIGLGSMGMGMACSLRRAGLATIACDINPAACEAFAHVGGKIAATSMEIAAVSDVLFLVVVNAAQVKDVLFGTGQAAKSLRHGSLVVGCSTVNPVFAKDMEKRLEEFGLLYLDAPISGGAAKAAAGEITVMASGSPEAFAKAERGFSVIAAKVYCMGNEAGSGSAMKMVNQLLAGVHIAAAAEAMALGLRMGLEARTVYDVITNAAGNSWMFENRMAHVVEGDYTPFSAVNIFIKDLGMVTDTARDQDMPVPMAATALQQFVTAKAAGYGLEDDSAVIKIFPGITLPEKD